MAKSISATSGLLHIGGVVLSLELLKQALEDSKGWHLRSTCSPRMLLFNAGQAIKCRRVTSVPFSSTRSDVSFASSLTAALWPRLLACRTKALRCGTVLDRTLNLKNRTLNLKKQVM